jgi:hypothetical protein
MRAPSVAQVFSRLCVTPERFLKNCGVKELSGLSFLGVAAFSLTFELQSKESCINCAGAEDQTFTI